MSTKNEQKNNRGPTPGIVSELVAAAAGAGTVFGGLKLGKQLFPNHNILSRVGTIGASIVAGYAASGLVYNVLHKRAHNRFMREEGHFKGFSPEHPATPENAQHYANYTQTVAQSGQGGALDAALNGMDNAGLGHISNALRRHRASPENAEIYNTVDAWLTELGNRSPETFAHIQREVIMLAIFADSVDYSAPEQLRDGLIARVIMAGIIHDIGKMALSPDVLHKDTRMPHITLSEHIASYDGQVLDYPEKEMDEDFLRMANGGRIPFGDYGDAQPTMSVDEVIAAINENPLLTEPEYTTPEFLASTAAIYDRIRTHAQNAGIAWLPAEQEAALLNLNRRGTLTASEMELMDSHDQIGNAMTMQAGINQALAIDPAIVNSKLPDTHLSQADKALRDMVHLTDLYEATTGERAYNANNGKEFNHQNAMQVLAQEAEQGRIAPESLAAFEQAQIAERYHAIAIGQASTPPQSAIQTQSATTQPLMDLSAVTSLAQK